MLKNEGIVTGSPKIMLRFEGLFVFLLATIYYFEQGYPWHLYALLFFVPDLAILAYLKSPKAGASVYNFTHSYFFPLAFTLLNYLLFDLKTPNVFMVIWVAHIGFDRALGFGLKYPSGFKSTHLGWLGNKV